MQPTMPTTTPGRRLRCRLNCSIRPQIRCSALSRTEHVFAMIRSASSIDSVRSYPSPARMEKMTSVSFTFIWQPYVSM